MPEMVAADVMSRDVKTVNEQNTLQEAAELLAGHGISGMPVVNSKGKLVGMISEADLMNPEKRKAAIPRVSLFGLWPVSEGVLENAYRQGFSLKVHDLMSRNPVTATEDTTVSELAATMLKKQVNRIPILRDGEMVGIVTRHDVLKGMLPKG